jgi:hypothetical protein
MEVVRGLEARLDREMARRVDETVAAIEIHGHESVGESGQVPIAPTLESRFDGHASRAIDEAHLVALQNRGHPLVERRRGAKLRGNDGDPARIDVTELLLGLVLVLRRPAVRRSQRASASIAAPSRASFPARAKWLILITVPAFAAKWERR